MYRHRLRPPGGPQLGMTGHASPSAALQARITKPLGSATLAAAGRSTLATSALQSTVSSGYVATFVDLATAPLGAWVSEYGMRTDGNIVKIGTFVHDGTDPRVTTPTGACRILTATPATLAPMIQNLQPGDHIYLRGGTYSARYDNENWNESNFCLFRPGTAAQPIALVAYPGEQVTIQNSFGRPNFQLGNGTLARRTGYITIAGFDLVAPYDCIFSGAYTPDSSLPRSGAYNVRIVGNNCRITDTTTNTMTAIITAGAPFQTIMGNTIRDPVNRVIINNNHAIYIQCGATDVVCSYNDLRQVHTGHVIQVHQDGAPMLYERIVIEGNIMQPLNIMDCRGITVTNVQDASTVTIRRNKLYNLGQNFSAICVYRGQVLIDDNDMIGCNSGIILNSGYGGTATVIARNNYFNLLTGIPKYQYFGVPTSWLTIESERSTPLP